MFCLSPSFPSSLSLFFLYLKATKAKPKKKNDSMTFFPKLKDLYRRIDRKISRTRGSGWIQGTGILQMQKNRFMYELTETNSHTIPTQVQTRQNSNMRRGHGYKGLVLTKKLLVISTYWESENQFSPKDFIS